MAHIRRRPRAGMSYSSLLVGARVPIGNGIVSVIPYECGHDQTHVAITPFGYASQGHATLYLHKECLPGDIFGSHDCDCRRRLDADLSEIAASTSGVLVYLKAPDGPFSVARHVGNPFTDGDVETLVRMLRRLRITRVRLADGSEDIATGLRLQAIVVEEPTGTGKRLR